MDANTFGKIFRLTSFGESHGAGIGGIIDGCPAGLEINLDAIQADLNKRKPGQSSITTPRKEKDEVEFYSGIFEGKTTATPLAFMIKNTNAQPKDYSHLKDVYRPSHADYTYEKKYGIRDYRGGGRSSARETAARVVAGSLAKQILKDYNIQFSTYVSAIHEHKMLETPFFEEDYIFSNIVNCPDEKISKSMINAIEMAQKSGESLGGIISCCIKNVPVGLGEPVFDKLHARLAYAMMGINAVKGFEIGSGFKSTQMKGSEHNDVFINIGNKISTKSNFSGGIQGGISNGEDIYFKVAFKPVATIMQDQQSIDKYGNKVFLKGKGRHDPCVLPRAVIIVECMAAMTILDFLLLNKTNKLVQ